MTQEPKLQQLNFSKNWQIKRNVFYDIDPKEEVSEESKLANIYCQEDMFHAVNGEYHFDLGWYGYDNIAEKTTGYMLILFRGKDFNNCMLLELFRTKSKTKLLERIDKILEAFESDFYTNKIGYLISENQVDYRSIGEHYRYSVLDNVSELIE